MTNKNLNLLLLLLAAILVVGCAFLIWFGLLYFRRPLNPAPAFQFPTETALATGTSSFQFGSPQPGLPTNFPPTPTFEQLADTATPQPAPTGLPVTGGLQGKIIYPHRFNSLNAVYQVDLSNNTGPAGLLEPVSNLFLTAPVISPDGTRVAFNYLRGDMYVLEIGSSQPVRLGACGAPSWSPDSSQLICKSSTRASFLILDAQTGDVIREISADPAALFPTWSPAGGEIIFNIRDSQRNTSIWRMSLADGAAVLLRGEEASENYAPSWSPDGQWIAFQSNQDSTLSEIWVMDRNGENARRVLDTPDEHWSRAPAWSPDGQWLAFVSDQAGSIGQDYGEIFVVSVATGESQQVTQTGGRVYDWRLSWGR